MTRPVVLIILDGFAFREEREGNAVALAAKPNIEGWLAKYPCASLATSGTRVGLPDGQMGNSEVGHQNIGAGRVIYQDLTKIDLAIENGTLGNNEVLKELMAEAARPPGNRTLHLMGLVSPGGVHSRQAHINALLEMAGRAGVPRTVVHAFLDGRDTPPKSALGYVGELVDNMAKLRYGKIATVGGRFYGMDRDNRWDRIEEHWNAIVHAKAKHSFADPLAAIEAAYDRGETDEFVLPTIITRDGSPVGKIEPGDAVFHFNFRPDRARQLTRALTRPDFTDFDRGKTPQLAMYASMTRYEPDSPLPAAFPPEHPTRILGEIVSEAGIGQFRCAETEKYAHVTYFLNGGLETVYPGEQRVLVPSVRDVPTYDLKPQMSAAGVTDELVRRIASQEFGLVVANYANPDMVGHTGVLDATIKAIEHVDECLGRVIEAARAAGATTLITADHGNAEEMVAPDGTPHTAHTLRDVPLMVIDDERVGAALQDGSLRDVAPTILSILGQAVPEEMTGRDLFA